MEKGKRGRPRKNRLEEEFEHIEIDFSQITKLNKLDIDPRMMEQMESGIDNIDKFISYEGGIPNATNLMICGSPGVGKTTVLLDIMSGIVKNKKKCLFVSAEMNRKQMFKYTQRFPQFSSIDTLFTSDFMQFNTKDVIEQSFNLGWDCILIDSIAEIVDAVREENGWDRKMAEAWLVNICVQNNKGWNVENRYTTFLLIQQMTKGGDTLGSNKLKHLTDATLFLRRESERGGAGTYMEFEKNRNGLVDKKLYYELSNNTIVYGSVDEVELVGE